MAIYQQDCRGFFFDHASLFYENHKTEISPPLKLGEWPETTVFLVFILFFSRQGIFINFICQLLIIIR